MRKERIVNPKWESGASGLTRVAEPPASKLAPPAATGSLNAQNVSFREVHAALSWEFILLKSSAHSDTRAAGRSFLPTLQSIRTEISSLGQQRHLRIRQYLNFARQSIATSKPPCASGSIAVSIVSDPE